MLIPQSRLLLLAICLVLLIPDRAEAYIGPGAGFALAGSFLTFFAAIASAIVTILTWPIRLAFRALFGWRMLARSRFRRVVILGLDGMDHGLTATMLAAGKLPHFAKLRDQGCFEPLGTTVPPLSPVAWSTFQTGVNPGKHNIFDFLTPDLDRYHAKLSSVEIRPPRRSIRLGRYRIPLGKASVRLLRKSKPFWSILGERGVFSCILRVPITFPPEKLRGVLLSAMCVPDLRGTQGMFSFYTTRPQGEGEKIGGEVHRVIRDGSRIEGKLVGPRNPFVDSGVDLTLPFHRPRSPGPIRPPSRSAACGTSCSRISIPTGSTWPSGPRPACRSGGSASSSCCGGEPDFGLYVTPINLDPEHAAMPVGYPPVYSTYLAKRQGAFATLGLAEDTWALNEHVIGDDHFIQQCLDIDAERETMFFDALDKVPRGPGRPASSTGTDRLQHTFWRDLDEDHPAHPTGRRARRPPRHRGPVPPDGRPRRPDHGPLPPVPMNS